MLPCFVSSLFFFGIHWIFHLLVSLSFVHLNNINFLRQLPMFVVGYMSVPSILVVGVKNCLIFD